VLLRAILKGLLLFVAVNVLFALVQPLPVLARLTLHNTLLPGRPRLPYADDPAAAHSLTLNSVDAMIASHALSRPKAADEYRVILIGDSATWGWFLRPDETLAGQLNALQARVGGRRVVVYNLGYPVMALAKDVLLLSHALAHQPDAVWWALTLESFPRDKQATHPLVRANADAARALGLPAPNAPESALDRTLWGRRRDLADLARLQLHGVMFAATGIDQVYPADYERAANDLPDDMTFAGSAGPLSEDLLAWDVLSNGIALARARRVDVRLINEPILIANGRNNALRYNFFYPRWAYDQYRMQLSARAQVAGVPLLDVWDLLPAREFTNSAVHTTPDGARVFAARVAQEWLR
jgi:hypothetical protein